MRESSTNNVFKATARIKEGAGEAERWEMGQCGVREEDSERG